MKLRLVVLLLLSACGTPTVHAGSADGGPPPASYVADIDGGKIIADGKGTSTAGGEGPGVAPECTAVDPAKVAVSDMALVPAGPFTMGCNESVDQECRADERPSHEVTLKAFEIDKTEVTRAQYYLCVASGACTFPKCPWDPCAKPTVPVSCLTRSQALTYCEFVGKRLPSEAEWEKSARGTDGRKYPWGNEAPTCALANIAGCGTDLEPVGMHPGNASPYGVLDLAGNVVEWTTDFYEAEYYATSPGVDPTGPQSASHYVGRGGGYLSEAVWHRTGSRDSYIAGYTRVSLGVRCAR